MRVHAYLLCWNEVDIMPLVIKHYQKFCDHIVILNNYSTDGSAELALKMGCYVCPFGTKFFDDSENQKIKNSIWKGAECDWVIVADFDELPFFSYVHTNDEWDYDLSMTDLLTHLQIEKESGTTIFKTIGWQIMSDEMPKHDLLEITNGYEFSNYAKNIIFNPQAIKEINYDLGSHECSPVGVVNWSAQSLYVLHYKHIGGVQRTIDRYKLYQKRMSKKNRQMGWGCHYAQSPAKLKQEWEQRMLISHPLL